MFNCFGAISGGCSGACSLIVFFTVNALLLNLFRILSLALRNNPMLFKKDIFFN